MSAVEEVHRAAAELVAAFGRGDLDGYFACFADDATFLFPTTGALLPSTDAYRREWSRWQDDTGFAVLACTTTDTVVQVHGDAAVLTHRVRTTTSERGVVSELDERETIVFCRQDDGRWLAVHEHLSTVPETT
ncbi:YybH family protein [Blastococcus saxobsidens]|uniref:Ketosteroid isomerase-like protein n=1 Tax=Blastococcus saxobsidens TaxID=138336 RepID=A0A4Q7Y654_9ACTN|nr:nuclear transport factor 2 family protein [Blastococcus saxobsidens]RZU32138.1 ketosteroid isomerase-like protein [Blastococcus saxobsidens]